MNKYERYRIRTYEEEIGQICDAIDKGIENIGHKERKIYLLKAEYLMRSIQQRLKRLRHGYRDYEWTVEAIHAERKKEHEEKNAVSDM